MSAGMPHAVPNPHARIRGNLRSRWWLGEGGRVGRIAEEGGTARESDGPGRKRSGRHRYGLDRLVDVERRVGRARCVNAIRKYPQSKAIRGLLVEWWQDRTEHRWTIHTRKTT